MASVLNPGLIPPLVEYGFAARIAEGEQRCGDQHLVRAVPGGLWIAVADGSGHGADAAAAAALALEIVDLYAGEGVIAVLRRCHARLRNTRGAVMGLACFDGANNTMTWAGVGNLEAVLARGNGGFCAAPAPLLMRAGVVGYCLPPLRPSVTQVAPGDILIVATDGIRRDFAAALDTAGPADKIAEKISARHSTGTDDGLVVVARYLGWPA